MGLSELTGTTQAGTVYLKKADTFNPFEWGGRWMKIEESTDSIGGLSVTTRQNPRGGIERDRLNQDVPGTVDFSLVMKQRIGDRRKTQLKSCFWTIDRRTHCKGRDRDDPHAWEEITRKCFSHASGRTTPASTWDGEEDALVTIPMQGLDEYDIYQVELSEQVAVSASAVSLVAADVCHPEKCPGCGDPEDSCVIIAVSTLLVAGSPVLVINDDGGEPDGWSQISLTEWTAAGASDVLCLGDFLLIASNGEAELLRSSDRGVTRTQVSNADMAANPPNTIDALDQNYVLVGGDNGYVYSSFDGGRTWETVEAGQATTQNINDIMIARDNPLVAYAVGVSNAIIKTENGGQSWFALTGPSAADALLTVWVQDQTHLLIINDDGELWETSDGGVTWTQQTALPSITATITDAEIVGIDCDVYFAVVSDGTDSSFYRNVNAGASGYWVKMNSANPTTAYAALAVCDSNRALAVGGNGTTANLATLAN